jgi:hypothetical protein
VHGDHLITVNVDKDPADRRADPAEAAHRWHVRTVLS